MRSACVAPLLELPALPMPEVLYRWLKLLTYRLRGEDSPVDPATPSRDLRSLRLDGPPRLEGPRGGDGLSGVTGEEGRRPVAPAPMGEGDAGMRDEVGELCAAGLDGRDGPAPDKGECCRREGEGECNEGEPEERVNDLKGLTGGGTGRRIGRGPAPDS
jgi:hypothetical protein